MVEQGPDEALVVGSNPSGTTICPSSSGGEQGPYKARVVGSNPALGTMWINPAVAGDFYKRPFQTWGPQGPH